MGKRKLKDYEYDHKYENYPESNQFSELHVESMPYCSSEEYYCYRPSEDKKVGEGAWVMIMHDVPVGFDVKPKRFAIYWGLPCKDSKNMDGFDESGRYKVEISVPKGKDGIEMVCIFPHEYAVINEEKLSIYKEEGWGPVPIDIPPESIDIELIEKYRSLVEEEREIIWALQVDGLTEYQACQEYFYSKHTLSSQGFYYFPTPEVYEYITSIFGE